MISYRTHAFIFSVATVVLFIAAVLSPHEEGFMDIILFGLSIVSGAISINTFKKYREEKGFRAY